MKKLILYFSVLFCTSVVYGQNDYESFYLWNDTLDYKKNVYINEFPVYGKLYDIVVPNSPDSVGYEPQDCGSVFDTFDNNYYYIFKIYYEGMVIDSNGDIYQVNSVDMKGNTFRFSHSGNKYEFTENTTEEEFRDIFKKSLTLDRIENVINHYVYFTDKITENYWIFIFTDNKLTQIRLFFLMC